MTKQPQKDSPNGTGAGSGKSNGTGSGKGTGARFPIVGIGASAGGLAAFEAFFADMPAQAEVGMAFVLVQHLAPDYASMLTDIIKDFTRMSVFEVEDGMIVQPNCVYVIPPNRDMAYLGGALQLLEPTEPRGHRMAIDFFFRSLAEQLQERAIGIVLSGTGSDGTEGIRAIKAQGGMVMAQNPASCEFESMPHSAIATGLVDYEINPVEMPKRLISYASMALTKLPQAGLPGAQVEDALKSIFLLLRTQSGHDFSQYKRSTIDRRIGRRMAVHQIETVDAYVKFLQQSPVEVETLFRDLLIGVTSFFRDPKVYASLEEKVIPKLFEGNNPGTPLRIWCAGCSSGEEAYSLAIVLREHMDVLKQRHEVQIFATDIDARAIGVARAGVYPSGIAADVSQERLTRLFTAESDGGAYRIDKSIRDMLIFSEQDVIKDPPFSKLDLISCRNLMIYFDADLQKKLIPLFHFALKPGGYLMLGTSEGVGGFDELFSVVDRESKIYRRKEVLRDAQRMEMGRFFGALSKSNEKRVAGAVKPGVPPQLALRELAEGALLQKVAPAATLVNVQGDILYLHGRTGMFLEPAPGVAGISNVLKMARDGLQPGLAACLHKSIETKETVHSRGMRVKTNGHYTMVDIAVHPVAGGSAGDSPLYLITFVEAPVVDGTDGKTAAGTDPGMEARIAALERDLLAKDEYIQAAQEELASSTEELRSSNEEMQSVNEELQSTNEELETSKEELQSVNEELATVNAELQNKVADLSRANNDMNNLLAGTGIATIFVDHHLCILRFTPAARAIINLIPSDQGRPVGHIVSNLIGYDALVPDVQSVLDTLVPKELEVKARDGKWYAMRVQPYRTLDNVIEGAVISFVDISEVVAIRDELKKANELYHMAAMLRDINDAVILQDLSGHILAWNPGAEKLYGWDEQDALGLNARDRIPPALREEEEARMHRLVVPEVLEPYHSQRLTKAGAAKNVWIMASAVLDEAGKTYAIATTERLKPD
ncbi:MAG: PAS domain-containing protein [Burkholderiaceae bacterium]|nr:PAS domain-containing protein [Burkholderiaceae bacterium]